jgi:hypothetical protein
MRYLILLLLIFADVGIAKAGQTTCKLSPDFSLLKDFDTANPSNANSWALLYKGRVIYQIDLHDVYGGAGPPFDCSNIVVNRDNFGLIVGHENDLLIAVGIASGAHGPTAINLLHYYPHDGRMRLASDGDSLLLTWGEESDLTTRLCWSPNNDNHWWHVDNHQTGGHFAGCTRSDWIWHQGNTTGVWGTDPSKDHSRIDHIIQIE